MRAMRIVLDAMGGDHRDARRHGGSSVKAFRNAIDVARTATARKLNRHIEEAVSEFVASTATDDKLKEGA
jgi:fatty acid/phospholipid biosynthesis enzyme